MVNDFNVTHEDSIAHPWSAKKGYYPRRLENLPLSKMCHPKLWREKEMGNGPHFWNNYTAGLMMIDDYYSLKRRQTTGIEQLWYRLFQGLHPCRRIGRGSPKIVLSSQAAQKKQFGTTNSIHLQNTDFSWVVFVWISVRYTCVQYVLPHVVWLIDQGL